MGTLESGSEYAVVYDEIQIHNGILDSSKTKGEEFVIVYTHSTRNLSFNFKKIIVSSPSLTYLSYVKAAKKY